MLNLGCLSFITLSVAASLLAAGCYVQASNLQQETSSALLETVAPATLSSDSNLAPNINHKPSYLQKTNRIDAPKHYHLNALLYKPLASNGGEANLRPLSGVREEEGSAIDSLLRAMRRQQSSQADAMDMANVTYGNANGARRKSIATNNDAIGPDDEATIQRKSIDSLDGSSRLRGRDEPRRKRRAIVKNVPPKLHSRRISKLSRRTRTKLRLKPKRRA